MSKSDESKAELIKEGPSQKMDFLNNTFALIASAFSILMVGFGIGFWVANVEYKNNLLQNELNHQIHIVSEKEKWEDKQKDETKLDEIVRMLNAVENSNRK